MRLKNLGNFHRVVVDKGQISCSCQSYMKWKTCYEVKEFGVIINKTCPHPKYVDASGESWTKNSDQLVKKQQQEIFETVTDKMQLKIKSSFPDPDAQRNLRLPQYNFLNKNNEIEEEIREETSNGGDKEKLQNQS